MMQCELCGKESDIVKALIEGVEMNVCRDCAKFGKITEKPQIKSEPRLKKIPETETAEAITPDFAQKIRSAREKRGLKQEDFAKLLNEKMSIIHKIETGKFTPSIPLAKKLEKILNINLVEEAQEETQTPNRTTSGSITIGDIIKKK